MTQNFFAGSIEQRVVTRLVKRPAPWPVLALTCLFTLGAGSAAVADRVVLTSGASLRGTIAHRSQLLRAPGLVTAVELRLEQPGVDSAGVRALVLSRAEVAFVVLEDGRWETTVPLSAPGPSSPRTRAPQQLWLAITVSHSTYAMADLKAGFATSDQPIPLASLHPVGSGLGVGMELGVDLPTGFGAGLAWDRIRANGGTGVDSDGSLSVSAFLLRAFGSYGVVRSNRGSLRLGASLGAVVPSVVIHYPNPDYADYRDRVVGVAPAAEVFCGGDLQVYPWLGGSLVTGYRRAISRDVPIATFDVRDLDYSGWFVRAGARFSMLE